MNNARKKTIEAPNGAFGRQSVGPPIAGERTTDEKSIRAILSTTITVLPDLPEQVFKQVMSAVQAEALSRFGDDSGWREPPDDAERGLSGMSNESLVCEVEENLKAISELRKALVPNGRPAPDLQARDVTSFVTASTAAYERLVKFRDRIINQSRLAAMERAVLVVLKDADQAFADSLVDQMEIELEKIS